jgi:protein phosphatase
MNKKSRIVLANKSDVGKVRQANEDYFGYFSGSWGELIVVSDGMGGNKGGYTASRVAIATIKNHFESLPEQFDEKEELRAALVAADVELKRQSQESEELREMGATAVILLLRNDEAFTAHIGDSRIYLIREQRIYQLTRDHSLVQQLVDAKIITPEAAKVHPKRNVISRSLGADGNSEPEVDEPFTLFKDDRFILCTDGLTTYVDGEELKDEVLQHSVFEACDRLVNLANERGGKDNITVQVVQVIKGKRQPIKLKLSPRVQKYAIAGAGLCLVGIGFVLLSIFSPDTLFKAKKMTAADSLRLAREVVSIPAIADSTENAGGTFVLARVMQANDYHEGDPSLSVKSKSSKQEILALFNQLVQGADRKLQYTLTIVRHPGLNCYTLPGGRVIITTGLIEFLNDKNQLAFLLAHQIGHTELRHVLPALLPNAKFANSAALLDSLGKLPASAFLTMFTSAEEIGADTYAVGLLQKVHLPVDGVQKFLSNLAQLEKKAAAQGAPRRDLVNTNLYTRERQANLGLLLKK